MMPTSKNNNDVFGFMVGSSSVVRVRIGFLSNVFPRLRLFPSYIFLASKTGVMRCRLPLRSPFSFPE